MTFWEELGQKISRGSQDAIQKTKDMASVLSLKADISDAERHIRELQAEIGKLVVDSQFEGVTKEELRSIIDGDESSVKIMAFSAWREIWEKVMMIRADEELIGIDKRKIAELDDKIQCVNCGKFVAKGTSFCSECGAKIIYPAPVTEAEEETVAQDTVEFQPEKPASDAETADVVAEPGVVDDTDGADTAKESEVKDTVREE